MLRERRTTLKMVKSFIFEYWKLRKEKVQLEGRIVDYRENSRGRMIHSQGRSPIFKVNSGMGGKGG